MSREAANWWRERSLVIRLLSALVLLSAFASGQSFTLVQLVSSSGCTGTTCSVTASLGAGHILFIGASTVNPGIKISSINVGGTYVPGWMTNGGLYTQTAYLDGGYIYPTTSTAGPIVVTFSGTTGGAHVDIAEVSFTGGTPSLDALNSNLNYESATDSVPGVGLNLTGSTDVVFQWAVTNTNLTAITAPYSTHAVFPNDETGQGAAIRLNTTSGAAPTWTSASGTNTSVTGAIAFGISASPCDPSFLVDFSGGTNGATPTPTDLLSSTFGIAAPGNGGFEISPIWALNYSGGTGQFAYSTTAYHPLYSPMRFCYGGNTYSEPSNASNKLGMQATTDGTDDFYVLSIYFPQYLYNGLDAAPLGTVGVWMMTDIPQTDTGGWIDTFTLEDSGGGDYSNASLEPDNPTGLSMHLECGGCTDTVFAEYMPIPTNAWFWVTMQRDASPGGGFTKLMVYDADLNPLGDPIIGNTGTPGNYNGYINIGRTGGYGSPTAGHHVWYDKEKACIGQNCPFPLLPVTPSALTTPPPGSTLSSSSVTFNWIAAAGTSAYWLTVGSTAGGDDYYSSGNLGNVLTTTVNGLPTNGSPVYVTLYSLIVGVWAPNTYTYTAVNAAPGGVITTPTPGSTLSGSSVTFNWTAGASASAYWLVVGSTAGGGNYYSSGNLGNALTATVYGLPTNGTTVYVTLYSVIAGAWVGNGYTYTAAANGTAGLAVMTSPAQGSTVTGNTPTFSWSAATNASGYWIAVGSTAGAQDIYQHGVISGLTFTLPVPGSAPYGYTYGGLPKNGSTIYVTLYSDIGGQWFSTSSSYVSEP